MAAMAAIDRIRLMERGAHAHRDRFLADGEVGGGPHLLGRIEVRQRLFRAPDADHVPQQPPSRAPSSSSPRSTPDRTAYRPPAIRRQPDGILGHQAVPGLGAHPRESQEPHDVASLALTAARGSKPPSLLGAGDVPSYPPLDRDPLFVQSLPYRADPRRRQPMSRFLRLSRRAFQCPPSRDRPRRGGLPLRQRRPAVHRRLGRRPGGVGRARGRRDRRRRARADRAPRLRARLRVHLAHRRGAGAGDGAARAHGGRAALPRLRRQRGHRDRHQARARRPRSRAAIAGVTRSCSAGPRITARRWARSRCPAGRSCAGRSRPCSHPTRMCPRPTRTAARSRAAASSARSPAPKSSTPLFA